MPDTASRCIHEAVTAFEYLAGRGGRLCDTADHGILSLTIPPTAVRWRGGIRQDTTGHLTFLDALVTDGMSEADAQRAGILLASAYLGFYDVAADGLALTNVADIKDWYGAAIDENYPDAGEAFSRFATTYWTFKVLLGQIEMNAPVHFIGSLLTRIDELLGPLFFPFPGPMKTDPTQREADQRRFLQAFGPRIDIDDFLTRNPILIRDRSSRRGSWWRRVMPSP